MKLVRYVQGQDARGASPEAGPGAPPGAPPGAGPAPRVGILEGDTVRPTACRDLLELLRGAAGAGPGAGAEALAALRRGAGASLPLESLRLLAPLPRPGKIFGSGVNYASHRQENPGAVLPVEPGYFAKLPSSVVGPGEPIVLPSPQAQVDYEVELAVVIGRPARGVPRGGALDYVFGYTVLNDVSDRSVQFKSPREQWITHGKGFDTFCPLGPALVTAGDVPDPQALRLRSWVNGEPRQDATTAEMLFPVAVLIEFWSRHITLEPGDVLATGTPAGCGTFRHPPLWLRPGDEVAVEVDAVGRLSNPVRAGW